MVSRIDNIWKNMFALWMKFPCCTKKKMFVHQFFQKTNSKLISNHYGDRMQLKFERPLGKRPNYQLLLKAPLFLVQTTFCCNCSHFVNLLILGSNFQKILDHFQPNTMECLFFMELTFQFPIPYIELITTTWCFKYGLLGFRDNIANT